MGNPLSSQENDWCITGTTEENLRPIPVAIAHKPCHHWIEVKYRPEHLQVAQHVESIVGINECCAAWLLILS